ncbi:diacylglycerol O-acyltransferase 1-like isoform 1-T2 [Spinachia spinachia]
MAGKPRAGEMIVPRGLILTTVSAQFYSEARSLHGFLIDVKKVLEHLIEDNCNWPCVNRIAAANIFAITALLIERSQGKGWLCPTNAHHLHLTNLGVLLLFPAAVIVHQDTISTGGAFLSLWFYTALGMKLYSCQETNRWYRQAQSTHAERDQGAPVPQKAPDEQLSFRDLYHFLFAPTLCYQRDFPRAPEVRINKLLHRLLEMVIVIQILVGTVQQWMEPIFRRSENSFSVSET